MIYLVAHANFPMKVIFGTKESYEGYQLSEDCILCQDMEAFTEKINAEILGNIVAHPFYGAKTVIMVLGDKNNPNTIYDGSLVIGNLMNAAASLGIGSCWIHRAKETLEREDGKALIKKWGLNGDYIGIGHVIHGYTNDPVLADGPTRKDNYVYYVK